MGFYVEFVLPVITFKITNKEMIEFPHSLNSLKNSYRHITFAVFLK